MEEGKLEFQTEKKNEKKLERDILTQYNPIFPYFEDKPIIKLKMRKDTCCNNPDHKKSFV